MNWHIRGEVTKHVSRNGLFWCHLDMALLCRFNSICSVSPHKNTFIARWMFEQQEGLYILDRKKGEHDVMAVLMNSLTLLYEICADLFENNVVISS